MSGKIDLLSSLEEFFKDEVRLACQKQNLSLDDHVSSYVAHLLVRFSQSSSILDQQLPTGDKAKEPVLALLWLEGLQKRPAEQLTQMQYLGDVALFTSGFFSERIEKSLIDRDYYMAIGGQAYQQVGTLQKVLRFDESLREMFFTLSQAFPRVVSVLEEISIRSQATQQHGIVKLYEKWLGNHDHKIRRVLQENGVIPNGNSTKGEKN